MKKRLLVLVLSLFVGMFLVACTGNTPEPEPNPEKELTKFHIFFNDNVTIDFGSEFNVLNGVTVVGDDYKDYSDKVTYTSTATISATHMLDTTVSGTVTINYRVSVGEIVGTKTRTITVREEAYVEPKPVWKGYNMTVENADDKVTITYADTPSQWWNNNVQLAVKNFDGTKNSVKFTFTGVATHEYLFKIEGPNSVAKEQPIVADGTLQTVIIDLSLLTEAQRNTLNLIVFFVKTLDADGTVVVNDWTYGDTLVVQEPKWVGYNFTVVENANDVTLTYPATPANWWENNAQLPVVGFDGTKSSVKFTFTGVATHEYVFKIEAPGGIDKEESIVADGTEQTITLDLSGMTEAQRSALNLIIIFVKTPTAAGSVTVKDWAYGVTTVVEDPVWKGYNFTVVETETDVTLTYPATPANWWENNAQLPVVGFDGTKNSVKFTFTGVATHEYLFKIEGVGGVNSEKAIIADGTEQTVVIDLSLMPEAQRNSLNLIIVFVKTQGAAGSVVVKNWEYGAFITPQEPEWQTVGAVTVVKNENTVTINYTDTPNEWWNNHAKIQVVDFDQTKTSVVFTFTGVVGHEYVFKVEGPASVNKEQSIVATGESQVFTLDISTLTEAQRDTLNLIVVFCKTLAASGTIVITNIQR